MSKTLRTLALALALCGAVTMAPVTLTGCKSPSAQTQVYKSLSTVATAVNSAYAAYLDLVVAGKVPTTNVASVSTSYQLFQSSLQVAVNAAQGNTNAVASQALLDAGAKVINDITLAKGGK